MIRFFTLLFLVLLPILGYTQVLENYEDSWVEKSEVAFWEEQQQKDVRIFLSSFPESFFQFEIPGGSTVFIEEKLWNLFPSDTTFSVSSKDLSREFAGDTLWVSVIGNRSNLGAYPLKVSKVAGVNLVKDNQETVVGFVPATRFLAQPVKDFYLSSLLLILFLFAVYRIAYPYLLGVLLQPLAVINAEDFSESGSLQKVFSFDILFYLFIVAMMMAQCLVTAGILFRKDWIESIVGWDFSSIMLLWISISLFILIITILKFTAIRVISYLFDMGKSDFAHFFYLLRLIVFGFSAVILVSLFFVINAYSSFGAVFGVLMKSFFWFYVLGVFGLFLIMMDRLSFKKYHLFTYLCIAEIVPFLILSKWIMVLGQ